MRKMPTGERLGITKFPKIKKEMRESKELMPKHLRRVWLMLVGEDGNGGSKGLLEQELGYRYTASAIKERSRRLEMLRRQLQEEIELQNIPIVKELLEMNEELADENDLYSTFVFGDEKTDGLFDQKYPDGSYRSGIFREIINASLYIFEFQNSLEYLAEAREEIDDGIVSFKEFMVDVQKDANKLLENTRKELAKLEQQKNENRQKVQEMEEEILGIKQATTEGDFKKVRQISDGIEELEVNEKPKKKW